MEEISISDMVVTHHIEASICTFIQYRGVSNLRVRLHMCAQDHLGKCWMSFPCSEGSLMRCHQPPRNTKTYLPAQLQNTDVLSMWPHTQPAVKDNFRVLRAHEATDQGSH